MVPVSKIQRYSTRVRGFHLRNYHVAGREETEMFTAELYLDEERIGYVRNHGTGGPDLVDVHTRRTEWQAFAEFIHRHPMMLDENGKPPDFGSPDEDASAFLRTMAKIEDDLRRSRKYRSGVMGHVWGDPSGSAFQAVVDAVQIFWEVDGLDGETMVRELSPTTFWIVVLGRDNAEFLRPAAPHLRPAPRRTGRSRQRP
jgi:hypothetical protein